MGKFHGRGRISGSEKRRIQVSTSNSRVLEDVRIGTRLKVSALWIAVLFLFAYGDIFGFFAPGRIEEVMRGEISGIEITELYLFAISVYVAIASVMVFLSLVLKSSVIRWANIVLPILYITNEPRRSAALPPRLQPVPFPAVDGQPHPAPRTPAAWRADPA
jgi:hypothetical protein